MEHVPNVFSNINLEKKKKEFNKLKGQETEEKDTDEIFCLGREHFNFLLNYGIMNEKGKMLVICHKRRQVKIIFICNGKWKNIVFMLSKTCYQ